ncbi:MAG: Holliday junction branch migration protein RuvA [Mariprofundaceae bacterium]|nr:Holliday junction branch migration protein RuvA [Mariprofundaceae bacterium]
MIGWLSGSVRELDPSGSILLEVNGVGYDIAVSMQALCSLKQGETASVYIHTYVREDQLSLFGFQSSGDRELFRKLNSVSGIGARTALNLMSGMPTGELLQAIDSADDSAIARTPGIGKKTAQRLILELKGKLTADDTDSASLSPDANDIRSALTNLGYKPAQVDKALKHIDLTGDFEKDFRSSIKVIS